MRTHTQAFKDGIKAYGRQFEDKIYYNSQTYTGDHIFSVNYSVDTSLCKSIMQVLKIDTDISMNIGDTLDYGISIVGVTGSEIRFNNFIVNKIEEQKDKKSKLITCYDNMVKSMQDYESFYSSTSDSTFTTDKNYYELDNGKYKRYTGARTGNPSTLGLYQSDFPMTVRTYLGKICTRLGITFGSSSDTFTNYNKNVLSEHYIDVDGNPMGYTYRDVLDDIAEATGRFIRINNTGSLIIRSFTTTNDTINEEFFNDKNVNIGEKVGPYNVVVLSRGDGSDNLVRPTTLPQTTYEFKIEGNPILDQTNREDFIDGIYNNINGLEFYANDFATKGILYLEAGDKYNVSIDSTTYPCLMLSDNIKRTQGLTENIVTKEPKETVTDYKYASSTDKLEIQSRNAYFLADKANGTASMIVEGIGSNGQVTGASVIASINDDSSNLTLNADKINLNGAVTANNNFKIKNDGSVEINNGSIDLIDEGELTTQCRVSITDVNNNYLSELYSYSLKISSNEIDSDTGIEYDRFAIHYGSGYNAVTKQTYTNNEADEYISNLESNGTYTGVYGYQNHWDTQGNGTQIRRGWYTIGADYSPAINLEYGNTTNLSVTNNSTGSNMLLNGYATINGDLYNNSLDLFNDTSGTDWQTMMKNKIDYCIANINTSKTNAMSFINGGWLGVNYGYGVFSKIGSFYQLVWICSDFIAYCRKSGNDYLCKKTDTIFGTDLFSGTSTGADIQLSDDVNNYTYLEIIGGSTYGGIVTTRIQIQNTVSVCLTSTEEDTSDVNNWGIIIPNCKYTLDNYYLRFNGASRVWKYENMTNWVQDRVNSIYVFKVIGYKY